MDKPDVIGQDCAARLRLTPQLSHSGHARKGARMPIDARWSQRASLGHVNRLCAAGVVGVLSVATWILVSSSTALAQYQPATLAYMSRGDRSEGLVTEQKSAEDIRLLSALVDVKRRETYNEWPAALRLRFYLPNQQSAAHVTLRQIPSPKGYYMLGNLTPPKPWTAASINEYRWPTTVISRVYEYQVPTARRTEFTKEDWMADLGVVVTLGEAEDAAVRQKVDVAPAALFHSDQPLEVAAYQFTFRTNAPATVTDSILSGANERVISNPDRAVTAGRPFTVRWPVSGQAEGWYQLTLDVRFTGGTDGKSQQRVVRFYHRRSLSSP
jgi:hypothetical protein